MYVLLLGCVLKQAETNSITKNGGLGEECIVKAGVPCNHFFQPC